MSAYRPYPKYKPSDVEWLGDVPEGWEIICGRRLFQQKREPRHISDEQLSATQKYGVLPQSLFMEKEEQKVVLALSGIDGFKHVQKDDFVISLRSFQGGIEHSAYTGCVSPAYTVLRPNPVVAPKFFAQALKCEPYIAALQAGTEGIRDGKNISYEQFGAISLPLPPRPEQIQIAAFLDRECGKLDALQAKQERLIELLKEKRQALISHAVSKGLDPNAKLKPSGIEWLGDVPEHWRTPPFYAHLQTQLGKMLDSATITGEYLYPYLRNTDVQWHGINTENLPTMDFSPADKLKFSLRSGDLLACEGGECGRASIWEGNGETILYQKALHRVRSMNFVVLDPKWMLWILRAAVPLGVFKDVSNPATIDHLPAEKLRAFRFTLPPLTEQRSIVAHLDEKCGKIDQLKAKAERAIALLKERRSALISAAVMGKIDVREARQPIDFQCADSKS